MRRLISIILAAGSLRADITSNLAMYVPFTEAGGATAADTSGNGLDMSIVAGTAWNTPGPNGTGSSISLNGTTQYASTSATACTSYPCSLLAWVYVPTSGAVATGAVISVANSSATSGVIGINVSGTTGKVSIVARPDTNAAATCTGNTDIRDAWHLVSAVLISATERRLYVDGIEESGCGSGLTSKLFPTSTNQIAVGRTPRSSPTAYLYGRIARARVYTRGLTSSENLDLYNYDAGIAANGRRIRKILGK